jgi:RNA binding exosome subunit
MWSRCSRLRVLVSWQFDSGPSYASGYVGNVVTVLPVTLLDSCQCRDTLLFTLAVMTVNPVTLLVTMVQPRPRGMCT